MVAKKDSLGSVGQARGLLELNWDDLDVSHLRSFGGEHSWEGSSEGRDGAWGADGPFSGGHLPGGGSAGGAERGGDDLIDADLFLERMLEEVAAAERRAAASARALFAPSSDLGPLDLLRRCLSVPGPFFFFGFCFARIPCCEFALFVALLPAKTRLVFP
jgi:hypothetical protein